MKYTARHSRTLSEDFTNISEDSRKIFDDFSNISKDFPNISKDFPKTSDIFICEVKNEISSLPSVNI